MYNNLKTLAAAAMAVIAAAGLTACSDDDKITLVEVPVSIERPSEVTSVSNEQYVFSNVTTGVQSTFTDAAAINVEPGLYNIAYRADVQLHDGLTGELRANATSVTIDAKGTPVRLTAYLNLPGNDLIIAEIFFSGTKTAAGKQYIGDQYIKLYNNTDHVLYADGVTLFETDFMTTTKYADLDPDNRDKEVAVDALYTVPGSGKDHPVQPGEYFTIADIAIDHRTSNPLSFDLSHADFEWYDESSNPNVTDIDAPAPNLDKVYCYTKTIFMLHNRGFKCYGIARLPQAGQAYLDNNRYEYKYNMVTAAGTFPMSKQAYKVDNRYILDYVSTSVETEYQWNITSPAVDCGWTSCGTLSNDPDRFFHSVRRKLLTVTDDGRAILKDTNNSTDDFNANVIASEIELQGTAVNTNGDKATVVTYDGVTPKK